MMKRTLSAFLTFLFVLAPAAGAQTRPFDAARHVNPFTGTANSPLPDYLGGNASGNTFPGATVPFGMVQFSPDTERGSGC
jgi:putative alpha-1,2-mannosidase